MSAIHVRAQRAITVTTNIKQARGESIDAGAHGIVVVQVNRLAAATIGSGAAIVMEHAAVLEENQFEPLLSHSISLEAEGPISIVVTGHTRHLRWTTVSMSGQTSTFTIDQVLRD